MRIEDLKPVLKYQLPLTDDGFTWNGKIIIVSKEVYDKLIKLANEKINK